MSQSLKLTTDGTQILVSNNYTSNKDISPVGCIICYAGQTVPSGWLFCDGSEVQKNKYPYLFTIIGNTYGVASNSDNFVLPNLKERLPVGNSNVSNFQLGNTGGNKTVTLGVNQLPSHTHTGTTNADGSHTHTINDPGHTHTQNTINDDFNNSSGTPPAFTHDNGDDTLWNNINTSFTGITINASAQHTHEFTTNSTGSGDAVNVLPPYLVLNYIIKH
jgi:microcystin-dependent protein